MNADWEFLRRDVVMVSPLPPAADGIARYSGQLVDWLRKERRVVTVALPGGQGDHVMDLRGGAKSLGLRRVSSRNQDVVLHWHPHYFLAGAIWQRIATLTCLWLLGRLRSVVVVMHEPHAPLRPRRGLRGIADKLEEAARRLFWGSGITLAIHGKSELERFGERFPSRGSRINRVIAHGTFFTPSSSLSRADARARLGIDADAQVALCIGFISAHKGFDRAVKAFADPALADAKLYVVGSPLRDTDSVKAHIAYLEELAQNIPNVEMRNEYVDDERFDEWMIAADVVVAPYRSATSSSVIARAALLGTPAIASGCGGLAEQLDDPGVAFDDDDGLRAALASRFGTSAAPARS